MGFFEFCLEAMKSQLIQAELDMGFVGTHYDEQPNVVNASKIKWRIKKTPATQKVGVYNLFLFENLAYDLVPNIISFQILLNFLHRKFNRSIAI